jgi:hypothetical protein
MNRRKYGFDSPYLNFGASSATAKTPTLFLLVGKGQVDGRFLKMSITLKLVIRLIWSGFVLRSFSLEIEVIPQKVVHSRSSRI